jgi:hypothetical protein
MRRKFNGPWKRPKRCSPRAVSMSRMVAIMRFLLFG